MSRLGTTALIAACAGLAACGDRDLPTESAMSSAEPTAAPRAAALRWARTRLSNGRGEARAINSKGQVTGYHDTPSGTRAFIWSSGTMRNLGTLGGGLSQGLAINEAGQVVGRSTTASGADHAFRWTNGTMVDLGTLGAYSSTATAIESGGRVVGYTDSFDGIGERAFIWENGVMKRLAGLGMGYSVALDIDNMGRVVGQYGNRDAPRAFLWQAGKVTNLGALPGGHAVANAIGNGATFVGSSNTAAGLTRAVLWQNGTIKGLGALGGGSGSSSANAISGQGHVTGWSQQPEQLPQAFIWKDYVMSAVGLGTGMGVNRDGWVAGGWLIDRSYFPVVWRQTMDPPPPPGQVTLGTSFFLSERNGSVDPAVDTVAVGGEVTWTWIVGMGVPHSVQSVGTPSFPSSAITGGVGLTYKVKFTKAGTYSYNCARHPGNMTGRVVVR